MSNGSTSPLVDRLVDQLDHAGVDQDARREVVERVVETRQVEDYEKQAAAERCSHVKRCGIWTAVYYILGVPIVVLATLGGASGLVSDNARLAGILGFSAALLAAIAAWLQPQRRAARQRRLVLGYQTLRDRCDWYLAEPPENVKEDRRVVRSLHTQLNRLRQDEVKDDQPLPDLPVR